MDFFVTSHDYSSMKRFYKILRSLLVTLLIIAVVVPAAVYVALSLPSVQQYLCHKAEDELSKLLTVDVSIDYVRISPFNRVTLHGVGIEDPYGQKALKADRIGAGISIWDLLSNDRIVLSYAEIIGLEATIYRDSAGAPLNIQPIIDALAPKDKNKPPTKFDFRVNNVVIRTSSVSYDILNAPHKEAGFDAAHLSVNDLSADIRLPQIKNDDFDIELRRLTFRENSGFVLKNISGDFHIASTGLEIKGLDLMLPHSQLIFADIALTYDTLDSLKQQWRQLPVDLRLLDDSHIDTRDIAPFVPVLDGLDMEFDTHMHVIGNADNFEIKSLRLESPQGALIDLHGSISNLADSTDIEWDIPSIDVKANGPRVAATAMRFSSLKSNAHRIISNLGDVTLHAKLAGTPSAGLIVAEITTAAGKADINSDYSRSRRHDGRYGPWRLMGIVDINGFSGTELTIGLAGNALAHLGLVDAGIDFDMSVGRGIPFGTADIKASHIRFKQRDFSDLHASITSDGTDYTATLLIDNPDVALSAEASGEITRHNKSLTLSLDARGIAPELFIASARTGYRLSMHADAEMQGTDTDDIAGHLHLSNVSYDNSHGDGAHISDICINSLRHNVADSITITSDMLDGVITGKYRLTTVVPVAKSIISQLLPAITGEQSVADSEYWDDISNNNDFRYNFTLKTLDPLGVFAARLPIKVINPITLDGDFSTMRRYMSVHLDAPYLQQGNKLIENTSLSAHVNGVTPHNPLSVGNIRFTTTMPTKKGDMTLVAQADAVDNQIDTRINWKIDRDRDFSGEVNTSTRFSRIDSTGNLRTELHINPSELVFNDTVWTVEPAFITLEGKEITVEDFKVWRGDQYITMEGKASALPTDTITLDLQDVNLDYVFETLDISTAMFGGNATGRFYATEILTPTPMAFTPGLDVKALTYNHSLMGDAVIRSQWDPIERAVELNADISQPNERHTYVNGKIFPMTDSLDLTFDADKVEVGFLRHYMSAFASDISGYASGHARLWGTFKLIDLVGDVYGEDIRLTLAFTNTSYTTTDSVHLSPGRIDLRNLTLKDMYGNTAKLNGWVKHTCFKQPEFRFNITDARDLLVYDVKENSDTPWYGRVFGNGRATVSGAPGLVDININMATATGTAFSFVLSDELKAQEYSFITFRDRDRDRKDSIAALNAPPPLVQALKQRIRSGNPDSAPSDYRMTFNIDINPQALITLVMDPVGGDCIKAYGRGNMTMAYNSSDEDLRLNGTYTVDYGTYNFTLQEIIRKDFTISEGSSIAFNGDPYSAQLNITARYNTHGNLTDLDESFLDDKELNRTNVSVQALLKVRGDMRQPDISFDLDFPTLTEETKRKVRSIINTEEMMNRQIIYLLALSRFYTPDYMNATRGNEFVSVASSTISSQLSNMLGQLSNTWNIAPNFRSSRGDFSDVEVDVALSSHLLNNRLLLNGNLGYRDKSLNNNSFIGDFDIEYLLNRSGSLRLKAYNRYNDQNFYLKSALTTQGVGIVYKRDFDSFLSFLRPLLHKSKPDKEPATTDKVNVTTDSIPTDSIR